MAIDPQFYQPSIAPYIDWLEQNKDKASNESCKKLTEQIEYVKELAQKEDDITVFFGKLTTDNILVNLGTLLSEAMTASIKSNSNESSTENNDKNILNQYINTLISSMNRLKQELSEAQKDKNNFIKLQDTGTIIKALEEMIAIGKQADMTSPKFLRLQIERGLDRALEGKIMLRNHFEFNIDYNQAIADNPFEIRAAKDKLQKYDELTRESKLNLPDNIKLQYAINDIDYKIEKDIKKWHIIREKFEEIIEKLNTWSLSFCSFAPRIQPWSNNTNPKLAIIETQETSPGVMKNTEMILRKYFGMTFFDLINQPTNIWDIEHNNIWYSQELVQFLVSEIYPACLKGKISNEQIKIRAELYQNKKDDNPSMDRKKRIMNLYKKYNAINLVEQVEPNGSMAEYWNLDKWKRFLEKTTK